MSKRSSCLLFDGVGGGVKVPFLKCTRIFFRHLYGTNTVRYISKQFMSGGEIYLYDCEKYSPLLNDGTKMLQIDLLGPIGLPILVGALLILLSLCPLSFEAPFFKLVHC